MSPIPAEWFHVNKDAQIWAGHADNHKQFILEAPAAILAIDWYQGSYQFEEARGVDSEGNQYVMNLPLDPGYPQAWIRAEDVTKEAYVEPGNEVDPPAPPPEDEEGEPPEDEPDLDDELRRLQNEALGAAINLIMENGGKVCMAANSRYGCC